MVRDKSPPDKRESIKEIEQTQAISIRIYKVAVDFVLILSDLFHVERA